MLPYNFVRVKPDETGKIGDIIVPTAYKPENHHRFTGIVTEVPEELIYHGYEIGKLKEENCYEIPDSVKSELVYMNMETLDRDTVMEVEAGDRVWFNPGAIADAESNSRQVGNEYLLRYDLLYCVERNGEMIMLNGNILVSPVVEKLGKKIIYEKESGIEGVVACKGSMVKHYRASAVDGFGGYGDGQDIEVGQRILFRPNFNTQMEPALYRKLPERYFVITRRDICAYMELHQES